MQESGYHLKLTWGEQLRPSSTGRMARPVIFRLYRSYKKTDIDVEWRGGGERSV